MALKKIIIDKILLIEWQMFKEVKSYLPSPCQNDPNGFREIRESIYETWSKETLESYYDDLMRAKNYKRNLITEKYARMDGLIYSSYTNPLITKIVSTEKIWQEEIKKNYPSIFTVSCRETEKIKNEINFEEYLKAELETYSDRTIELYYLQILKACESKLNLAVIALKNLAKKRGYLNIDQAELELSNLKDNSYKINTF